MRDRVIIAGGGIGGLATALTLHQIGVPCVVFEAVREMRPLGVGINLQPNAVRELYDLGITEARSRPRRPARARNGRWSGSTATTSIPSRAGCWPATTGRNMRCIAASSTCCCMRRWWSGSGRTRSGSAAA